MDWAWNRRHEVSIGVAGFLQEGQALRNTCTVHAGWALDRIRAVATAVSFVADDGDLPRACDLARHGPCPARNGPCPAAANSWGVCWYDPFLTQMNFTTFFPAQH